MNGNNAATMLREIAALLARGYLRTLVPESNKPTNVARSQKVATPASRQNYLDVAAAAKHELDRIRPLRRPTCKLA